MKKLLKIYLCLFIFIIGIKVYAAANPYKEAGPYGTNCTWYAWKLTKEKLGVFLPSWGNAKDWYTNAKNDGYTVGTTPKANSIVVWGDWTKYGHVGYVEKVVGNKIYVWDSSGQCIDEEAAEYKECMANSVCEETDRVCKQEAKQIACGYDLSESYYTVTGYIYLDVVPEKECKSIDETTNVKNKEKEVKVEANKSNNAELNSIEISKGTVEIKKDLYDYNLEVENEVETFSISATPIDEKASVAGTGEYKLNVELNEIKLIVSAEDGSKKEYTIKVMRKEKELITDIEDTNKTEINNYKIIIISSICVLVILIAIFIIVNIRKKYYKRKM